MFKRSYKMTSWRSKAEGPSMPKSDNDQFKDWCLFLIVLLFNTGHTKYLSPKAEGLLEPALGLQIQ